MRKLILLVFVCFLATQVYGEEPDKLLENTCTVCHSLDRIKAKSRSKKEWEETVNRMITYGAGVSGKNKKIIIEYLTITYGLGEENEN
ncbi:hypothetical protein MYX76_13900 [Desulfobacterota bacterium AH_259_B03_O07]|nr:hypothetical protein [Desulfobacterota bacterium AH_259_B03_O07]